VQQRRVLSMLSSFHPLQASSPTLAFSSYEDAYPWDSLRIVPANRGCQPQLGYRGDGRRFYKARLS
jgi:hypothetical protein